LALVLAFLLGVNWVLAWGCR
jgi:hypothetical protein